MTTRSPRRPKRNLSDWDVAINAAFLDAKEPQPFCLDKPERFADYGYPLPSRDEADDACLDCPLMQLCLQNARHMRPKWGIWGGVVWVYGRQAHLLPADHPYLQDPDVDDVEELAA